MTIKEVIETINIAIAEVEWDYPMGYTVAFEEAIKALEKQMHNCGDCRHGDRFDSYHLIYRYEHNAIMSDDNCCRYWSDEDV